jgi:LPXTG-motif cell wall-anchored protein
MRKPLPNIAIGLISLVLIAHLVVLVLPGAALAQPERPTLAPTSPPAPTRRPERNPTDTPVPSPTEPPTATAEPAPPEPTPTPIPLPAQLPTTGERSAGWSVAMALLALLLLGAGTLLRAR